MSTRLATGSLVASGMAYALYAFVAGEFFGATIAWLATALICGVVLFMPRWLDDAPVTWQSRRRVHLRTNGGSYTQQEWRLLCERYGFRCVRCGKRRRLTADHVIPVSKGGSSNIENIQPLCGPCNSLKGIDCTDYR